MTLVARPRTARGVPVVLAITAGLAQVLYPLVHETARDRLAIGIVVLYAATAFAHAALTRGQPALVAVAGAGVALGFAVEVVGVHTGVPFGRYEYASSLGPTLFGVPVVIAFAWPMLAWPAALAARRLTSSRGARVLLGAWALAAWDVFLDPQMVAEGRWRWFDTGAHLPGVPHVPISNYLGWCVVALVMSALLQRALDTAPARPGTDDRVAFGVYLWTWASSTLALAVFLGLAAAALWGALAMGIVAVPLARSLRQ